MQIDVRSKQNAAKIDSAWVKKAVRTVLRGEQADAEVSVCFVDDREMSRLNLRYRGKKGPTDVLSFPLDHVILKPNAEESLKRSERSAFRANRRSLTLFGRFLTSFGMAFGIKSSKLLGDIVISAPQALRQAKAAGHPFRRETAFLLIHGALHLLGYDHAEAGERKNMFRRQEMYLARMDRRKHP